MDKPDKGQISLTGKESAREGEGRRRRHRAAGKGKRGHRPHPRDPSKREHSKAKGPAAKRRSQWKVMAIITGACLVAALAFQIFMKADMASIASFFLFGSTDPYMSSKREKELNREFTDMIKREFGPK